MAVVVTPDWLHNMDNNRQRTSPTNDGQAQGAHPQTPQQQQQQQLQHQQLLHQQQQQQMLLAAQQQSGYTFSVQQQPQGSWTPNVTAPPFYPSFYQNHQQQSPQQPYQTSPAPYFDPGNANAQLAAQWAYQQMMFNAQHGFPQHISPSQRTPNPNQPGQPQGTPDYFSQVQIPPVFNPFPSGTPPPHGQRINDQQGQEYAGFHPYKRPNRQPSSPAETAAHERRQGQIQRQGIGQVPHPPYVRGDASGSSSSVNSSSSQRQRTNSNQSAHSSVNNAPSLRGASPAQSSRGSPSPVASTSTSSPLRQPHTRNGSSSSSASTSTATSIRTTPSLPTTATSIASASTSTTGSASLAATPRLTRPSPLSQGNFTASEKRRSRDDIDLGAMHSEATPTATMVRSGGLKGRLRRALSFNAAQTLKEEADAEMAAEKAAAEGRDFDEEEEDDDVSIKASQVNGKLKAKSTPPNITAPTSGTEDEGMMSASTSTSMPVKKKGRAASLFNSRLNASTDNISLSSTVSSASVMIRKLGAMGKLARRNSLAGITSLFKDKDKDKTKDSKEEGSSKGKKKEKEKDKKTAKSTAAVASVSHVTAELDRPSTTGDWSVGADMNGLSPAAKLARQHTLKSNAEAAAKAKEAREAREAKEAKDAKEAAAQATAAAAAAATGRGNGPFTNGTQVPTWDRNTATRKGSPSPVKGGSSGGIRINEDGTRTLIEDDDDESDDGHYHQNNGQQRTPHGAGAGAGAGGQDQQGQRGFVADGWDDDEDWDVDPDAERDEDEEDVTIRMGVEPRESLDSAEDERYMYAQAHLQQQPEVEPWAVDVRRSVEKARKPAKGILKRAESYDQQVYLTDSSNPTLRGRSNSYNSTTAQSELGPLARIPSPDPDHIDGLHRHGSHSSAHGPSASTSSLPSDSAAPLLPPLTFDSNTSRFSTTFVTSPLTGATTTSMKDLPDTPSTVASTTFTSSTSITSVATTASRNVGSLDVTHVENRTSAIFQNPTFNSSAPTLSTIGNTSNNPPPPLTHRSATTPSKRLTFATNLSVYDTFSASAYDRRSEPATWSRLTPALAQRIKEELNSYKMEEMEVHAASRIHTQFFV